MKTNNKKAIIIGQGISGTMLSWFFHKQGIDFIIIDDGSNKSPSQTAAGLINPVTGRRVVTVWLDDVILPFAEKTYNELGTLLNINAIQKTSIIDFFPNPFMKESFLKKLGQDAPYINLINDESYLKNHFNYEFGAGTISPAYFINLRELLLAWNTFLQTQKKIVHSTFYISKLEVTNNKVAYNGIEADFIIFCDGSKGHNNPYFSLLPYALNKGEAIVIEAPDLSEEFIYKKSLTLVPFREKGHFWVGTNYIWEFNDEQPTAAYRQSTQQTLENWLKIPFKIVDHIAAVRPATVERRPFAGFHPIYKNVGILNGMGTKGCSLAPYFAHQLTQNILFNEPIEKEAAVERHARILSKTVI